MDQDHPCADLLGVLPSALREIDKVMKSRPKFRRATRRVCLTFGRRDGTCLVFGHEFESGRVVSFVPKVYSFYRWLQCSKGIFFWFWDSSSVHMLGNQWHQSKKTIGDLLWKLWPFERPQMVFSSISIWGFPQFFWQTWLPFIFNLRYFHLFPMVVSRHHAVFLTPYSCMKPEVRTRMVYPLVMRRSYWT